MNTTYSSGQLTIPEYATAILMSHKNILINQLQNRQAKGINLGRCILQMICWNLFTNTYGLTYLSFVRHY